MIVTKYNTTLNINEASNANFWRNAYPNWENDTFNFLLRYLNKNKTFVDIGAWIGPISLVAASYSKQCICYEPDEIACKEFIDNIELNNINNITLENKAVSIHNTINLGADELGASVTREDCTVNAKTYECVSLQDIFNKHNLTSDNVSVLKIDIEGHESELLQDKFLWELNLPMHISLHPGYKDDKDKYYDDIIPFFIHKGVNIFKHGTAEFFDVEIPKNN